jgi:SAM-dependent methyltransferase
MFRVFNKEVAMQAPSIAATADAKEPGREGRGGPDRTHLHTMWSSVAGGWAEHSDYVDARGAHVTEALLDLTDPRPGERVLELACGGGGVGLAAAERVAPGGEVVLSDVAPEMTAIAARRAAGHAGVSTLVLDLEDIAQPGASYDVVLCREGLMLTPDPGRAVREIARVLRPGGRVAVAVWATRERNPWLGVVLDAVSAQIGAPVPPPGVPGPFSLSDPDRLAGLLADAGLEDVAVSERSVPARAASFEDWWARTVALAGPLANLLGSLPAPAAEALRARARASVRDYETPDGLELPGVTLLASARTSTRS